uniref:HAD-IIIA family hydrolase n=1 Tax=Nakamurella endophytica TaxID=1748367 RepID=UPI001E56BA69|nr:HAD-IIIA family hydrolase [Nakamurella endophytica]
MTRRTPVAATEPVAGTGVPEVAVVVPTIGRPSLRRLLDSLGAQAAAAPVTAGPEGAAAAGPIEVVVVDDRPLEPADRTTGRTAGVPPEPLDVPALPWPCRVLRSGGRGPAAARNVGWRATGARWVAFLDDDVVVPEDWYDLLLQDLADAESDRPAGARTSTGDTAAGASTPVGGVQGRLEVPLPVDRRPTDWERNTAGLRDAAWATADMAYRRDALVGVEGFDERFPRAYREDADLAARVRAAGWTLRRGGRTTIHPVRPADGWVSVRVQAGNRDDALLRRRYGRDWRTVTAAGPGRGPAHLGTVAAAAVGLAGLAARRPRVAAAGALTWTALTTDFLRRRVAPGPRPREAGGTAELRRMLATSAVIPVVAVAHRLAGSWRHRTATAWPPPVRAVLFDRDGTLVHDVPYNGDPAAVRPVAGAREVLDGLRAAGLAIGVVSNQSGIARGLLTAGQVDAVNREIERRVGPVGTWQICPHGPDDGCPCRKPSPLLVLRAARALGVQPYECAVVGDIGADVEAARAAGAVGVLVPTPVTRQAEIDAAPLVAADLAAAVELALDRTGGSRPVPGSVR